MEGSQTAAQAFGRLRKAFTGLRRALKMRAISRRVERAANALPGEFSTLRAGLIVAAAEVLLADASPVARVMAAPKWRLYLFNTRNGQVVGMDDERAIS